eukprot:7383560-Prymnesium_polylepis.1
MMQIQTSCGRCAHITLRRCSSHCHTRRRCELVHANPCRRPWSSDCTMSAQTCRKSLLVAVALEHVTVVDLTPVTTVTRPLPTSQ